jgi:hypothetical protein
MVRAQLQLAAFFRMTAFAHGRLRQFAQYRVLCSVDQRGRQWFALGHEKAPVLSQPGLWWSG